MKLQDKKCKPCEGGVEKLDSAGIENFNSQMSNPWQVHDGLKISREYSFRNFKETINFVNKVADLSEEQGHHPVMHVYFSKLMIEIWTHAILGLSENDFILAAKIDDLH